MGRIRKFSLLLFITLGMAPLQMLSEEVRQFSAPGGEATIQKGDEAVLTAQARQLDGEPVLRVKVITERIPAR